MIAVEFKEVNVRIGEHQDEYETLPAHYDRQAGTIVFGFRLNAEELEQVKMTGQIFIKQYTNGHPMQPIGMTVLKEDLL